MLKARFRSWGKGFLVGLMGAKNIFQEWKGLRIKRLSGKAYFWPCRHSYALLAMKFPHFLLVAAGLLMPLLSLAATDVFTPVAAPGTAAKAAPGVRIDPTYWWVGMKNSKLQLLVNAPGIAGSTASLGTYPGVTLESQQKLESPNYLVVNLTIGPDTKPGQLKLLFKSSRSLTYSY